MTEPGALTPEPFAPIQHPCWNGVPILIGDVIEYGGYRDERITDTLWEIRWHPDGECWMHPTKSQARILRVTDLLTVNGAAIGPKPSPCDNGDHDFDGSPRGRGWSLCYDCGLEVESKTIYGDASAPKQPAPDDDVHDVQDDIHDLLDAGESAL